MTRRVRFQATWFLGAVAAAAVIAACSGNNSCTQVLAPGQTLVGNYSLISFAEGGQTVPGVTGELRLHDTTYYVNIQNLPPPVGSVTDSGSYALSCNTISQKSVLPGGPQLIGTFAVKADTLSVDGTVSGVREATVWLKQ